MDFDSKYKLHVLFDKICILNIYIYIFIYMS